jgi:hypothetical protein
MPGADVVRSDPNHNREQLRLTSTAALRAFKIEPRAL